LPALPTPDAPRLKRSPEGHAQTATCSNLDGNGLQVENVAYTHSLKELTLLVNTQQAITKDNVTIRIDAVLYIRIVDPFKASYGVDKPLYAVMQLAQTSMRSELGKMTLDNTFEERDALNDKIVQVCAAHLLHRRFCEKDSDDTGK
jgi:hypothetical protein